MSEQPTLDATADVNEVFDLSRASREQRAKRKPWKFDFDGARYEMANLYSSADLNTIEAAQEGQIAALRKCLNAGLGGQAEKLNVGELMIDELTILFEKWSEASGSEPGE